MSRTESRQIVAGTARDLIRGVADRWRDQYTDTPTNPKFAEILDRLESLDKETATVEDVEAIIGNSSWTRQTCNVCEREVQTWVRLGDEPDWESATVYVCAECLAAATVALEATT